MILKGSENFCKSFPRKKTKSQKNKIAKQKRLAEIIREALFC